MKHSHSKHRRASAQTKKNNHKPKKSVKHVRTKSNGFVLFARKYVQKFCFFLFFSKVGLCILFFFLGFSFHAYFADPILGRVSALEEEVEFIDNLPDPLTPPPFVYVPDENEKDPPPFVLVENKNTPKVDVKKKYKYDVEETMIVTGYCACQKCCSWKHNFWGIPVYKSGPNKGKPKVPGQCANGTMARVGTIAAPARFPFGVIMEVPGYPVGTVQDRGGAITGNHIDLYFKDHATAQKWGRKKLKVKIWKNIDAWRADHPEFNK